MKCEFGESLDEKSGRKEKGSSKYRDTGEGEWAFTELQTLYLFYCISYNMYVYKKK